MIKLMKPPSRKPLKTINYSGLKTSFVKEGSEIENRSSQGISQLKKTPA